MKNSIYFLVAISLSLGACTNENNGNTSSDTLVVAPPPPKAPESLAKDTVAPPPPVEDQRDNKVYNFVSLKNPPTYPGGVKKFYDFLSSNIKYPPIAAEKNIQGNVFTSFVVEKDGSLSNIEIDRKLGGGIDEEAVRVLKMSGKWNPGMQNGKAVRVKYMIPIKFTLDK